jgi:hypothetical protein
MKNAEATWDGKTIQDVPYTVGPTDDPKLMDDGQPDIIDDEIDLECEDWFGSIEDDETSAPARRPAA